MLHKAVLAVFLCALPCLAQQEYAQNVLYMEGLGSSLGLISYNYERLFTKDFSVRAGFAGFGGNYEGDTTQINYTSIPVTMEYFLGTGSHILEIGAGITGLFPDHDVYKNRIIPTGILGYRYTPRSGGFLFRISITPYYGKRIHPFLGVSFGWAFQDFW